MKTKLNFIITVLVAVSLVSCKSTFYQVYKATPVDKSIVVENDLIYEDENCKISYNFWSSGGDAGFTIYNKTNENLYLNLAESFFVLNGVANNYYKDRVYSHSTSTGIASSSGIAASINVTGINFFNLLQTNRLQVSSGVQEKSSAEFSVSYNEEKIVCIPPKTSKTITEYLINKTLYRDCGILRYPTRKKITSENFTITDSPIIFSNVITYSVGQSTKPIQLENKFYISEISNYPQKKIIESRYEEECGEKTYTKKKYFKSISPDKFYIMFQSKTQQPKSESGSSIYY